MKYLTIFLSLIFLLISCSEKESKSPKQVVHDSQNVENHPDYEQVAGAIEDYLYGLYDVAPEKIENSVDTTLRKIGYWYDQEKKTYHDNLGMSYDQLYHLAGDWNKDGTKTTENSPKKITIFEINDKTAIGKLEAEWGFDYFQLAKVQNKWRIVNVMWQSYPPSNE